MFLIQGKSQIVWPREGRMLKHIDMDDTGPAKEGLLIQRKNT
jgi:hypothetical protein